GPPGTSAGYTGRHTLPSKQTRQFPCMSPAAPGSSPSLQAARSRSPDTPSFLWQTSGSPRWNHGSYSTAPGPPTSVPTAGSEASPVLPLMTLLLAVLKYNAQLRHRKVSGLAADNAPLICRRHIQRKVSAVLRPGCI